MPTQQEMAEAYIIQVEQKVKELEAQVAALKTHIQECKDELTNDEKESKETKE